MTSRGFAIGVLGSIGVAIVLALPSRAQPLPFDAVHMYLPMAKHVLDEGWSYLRNPESLAYAPFAFLYPALLGAHESWIRWMNLALYCATVAMAGFAVRDAHSRAAGVVAAMLVASSPLMHPWVMNVFTEPPFIFLTALWLLAAVRGWWIAGAIAFTLAVMTRPAAMYFAPVMLVVFALRRDKRQAGLYGIATVLIAAWVVRNAITFGFPAIAAGAGNALFHGINPLVDGFDPPYYGLTFDDGAVTGGATLPLSIAGDRLLSGVAVAELRDTPFVDLARIALHKAFAFFFVTGADEYNGPVAWLRFWRVLLVVPAAAALWMRWRTPLVALLGALIAYMVAVHLPLLYTHRYSVGAIDLPLSMLAAIGIADLATQPARAAAAIATTTLIAALGLLQLSHSYLGPHIDRVPYQLVWTKTDAGGFELGPNAALDIPVRDAPLFHPWDMVALSIDYALAPHERGAKCDAMTVRYAKVGEDAAKAPWRRVPILADGQWRTIVIGGVPLALNHEGTLRIEFDCAAPAALELGRLTIAAPRRATHYREQFLGKR